MCSSLKKSNGFYHGRTVDFGGCRRVRLFDGVCSALHYHPMLPLYLQRNKDLPERLDSTRHSVRLSP